MTIPLWMVPLLAALILATLGWAGERRRQRRRTRVSWGTPAGVSAQDAAEVYEAREGDDPSLEGFVEWLRRTGSQS